MQKFYIVPEKTKLYDDFINYEESSKAVHDAIHEWCEINDIKIK